MTGVDIPFPEIEAQIHQPTMLEISYYGEECYQVAVGILTMKKEQIFNKEEIQIMQNISNFQIFCEFVNNKKHVKEREYISCFLSLLFTGYIALFTPQSIILKDENNNIKMIDENTFDIFQELLTDIFCLDGDLDDKLNPLGEKATKIAEKMKKMRSKIAKMNEQKNSNGSYYTSAISCLVIGTHIPLRYITELTVFQIRDLIKRYSLYKKWDIDIQYRLVPGAQPQEEVEDWMRNIH